MAAVHSYKNFLWQQVLVLLQHFCYQQFFPVGEMNAAVITDSFHPDDILCPYMLAIAYFN